MIYFVDEDKVYMREYTLPLILRGHKVRVLINADQALAHLRTAQDIELVVVDIMLTTASAEESEFTSEDTDRFLKTGLVLMEKLIEERSNIFPSKFIVLTAASGENDLITSINTFCNRENIKVLSKGQFRRPANLADLLLSILSQR